VVSGSHASTDCVWTITLVAGLCTACRGEQVVVVIRFNGTFLPLRPYWKKICTCFLNDAESQTMYGCALLMQSNCLNPSLFFKHYNRI